MDSITLIVIILIAVAISGFVLLYKIEKGKQTKRKDKKKKLDRYG